MEKLNIAELLKNCPTGMELDCTMYEDVYFDYVDELNIIHCYIQNEGFKTSITFNQHGTPNSNIKSKCVIFPKGKTSWEGFIPLKEGDVIISTYGDIHLLRTEDSSHCSYRHRRKNKLDNTMTTGITVDRLATEEEKQLLFDTIKDNGYKWNPETKTLERLIEPIFKVGDRIRPKNKKSITKKIGFMFSDSYVLYDGRLIFFKDQEDYELIPDKFEINTLKPFDQVLVRNSDNCRWVGQFYTVYNCKEEYPFECVYNCWKYCIPYKGNEHLLDKTDDCSNYYKTWE